MNEPKRRGRPPKAAIEGADVLALPVREMSDAERFDAHRARLAADGYDLDALAFDGVLIPKAQAYALRVWNGQSPNVPRNERIRRVKAALEGQNLPFEGVELP